MLPRPAADGRSRRGPASERQGSNAVACGCRSRQQNAHVTEERRVLYPWHPWFGLTVHVHEAVERRGTSTFRCSLDGRVTGRWLELPAWMFEPAACVPMRIAPSPQTSATALAALDALLRDAAGTPARPPSLHVPVSGVGRDPCHQNRRATDGPPWRA